MTSVIGGGVTLLGLNKADDGVTYNLATAVTQLHLGWAMSVDTTAGATLKVAADGEVVFAPLETFEDRRVEGIKVGAVKQKGWFKFPYTGTLTVGSSVVANGLGGVKTVAAANNSRVVQLLPGNFAVVRITN
jgi:hypothetical protein